MCDCVIQPLSCQIPINWLTDRDVTTTTTTLQPFNGLFSRTTLVRRYQKGKTNLDFTGARDSEWQWHQLGHMQVCTSLQTDNHASTPPLCFLQAGCPSCRPTNSVKALKAQSKWYIRINNFHLWRTDSSISSYKRKWKTNSHWTISHGRRLAPVTYWTSTRRLGV